MPSRNSGVHTNDNRQKLRGESWIATVGIAAPSPAGIISNTTSHSTAPNKPNALQRQYNTKKKQKQREEEQMDFRSRPQLGDLDSSDEEGDEPKSFDQQSIEERSLNLIAKATKSPVVKYGNDDESGTSEGRTNRVAVGRSMGAMPLSSVQSIDNSQSQIKQQPQEESVRAAPLPKTSEDAILSQRLARGLHRQRSVPDIAMDGAAPTLAKGNRNITPSTEKQKAARSRSLGYDDSDTDSDSDSCNESGHYSHSGYVPRLGPRRIGNDDIVAAGAVDIRRNRSLSRDSPARAQSNTNADNELTAASAHGPSRQSLTMNRRAMMQRSRSVNQIMLKQEQLMLAGSPKNKPISRSVRNQRRSSLGDYNMNDSESESEDYDNDHIFSKGDKAGPTRRSIEQAKGKRIEKPHRTSVEPRRTNFERQKKNHNSDDEGSAASGYSHGCHSSGDHASQSSRARANAQAHAKSKRRTQSLETPESARGKLDQKLSKLSNGGKKKSSVSSVRSGDSRGSRHSRDSNSRGSGNDERKSKKIPELKKGNLDHKMARKKGDHKKPASGSGGSAGSFSQGSVGSRKSNLDRMLKKPHYGKHNSLHELFLSKGSACSAESGNTASSGPSGLGNSDRQKSLQTMPKTDGHHDAVIDKYDRSPILSSDGSDSDSDSDSEGGNDILPASLTNNGEKADRHQQVAAQFQYMGTVRSLEALQTNKGGRLGNLDLPAQWQSKNSAADVTTVERALNRRDLVRSYSLRSLEEHRGAEGHLISRSCSLAPSEKKVDKSNRTRSFSVRPVRKGECEKIIRSFSMKNRISSLLIGDHSQPTNGEKADGNLEQDEIISIGSASSDESNGSNRSSDSHSDEQDDDEDGWSTFSAPTSLLHGKDKKSGLFQKNETIKTIKSKRSLRLGGSDEEGDDSNLSASASSDSSFGSAASALNEASKKSKSTALKKKSSKINSMNTSTITEVACFDWKSHSREHKLKRRQSRRKQRGELLEDSVYGTNKTETGASTKQRSGRKTAKQALIRDGASLNRSSSRESISPRPVSRKGRTIHQAPAEKVKNTRRQKSSDNPREINRNSASGDVRKRPPAKDLTRARSFGGIDSLKKPPRSSSKRGVPKKSDSVGCTIKNDHRKDKKQPLSSSQKREDHMSKRRRKKALLDSCDPGLVEVLDVLENDPGAACTLLDNDPTLAERKDEYSGCFPLHYACQYDFALSVIEKLLEVYPEACGISCDKHGYTPLHYAVEQDAATATIKSLIKACPRALKLADNKGMIPLHVAAASEANVASIRLLVFIFPESLEKETSKGETARKIAKRKKASTDILSALKSSSSSNSGGKK